MRQESNPPTGRHESSESIGGLKDTSHLKNTSPSTCEMCSGVREFVQTYK